MKLVSLLAVAALSLISVQAASAAGELACKNSNMREDPKYASLPECLECAVAYWMGDELIGHAVLPIKEIRATDYRFDGEAPDSVAAHQDALMRYEVLGLSRIPAFTLRMKERRTKGWAVLTRFGTYALDPNASEYPLGIRYEIEGQFKGHPYDTVVLECLRLSSPM